MKAQSETALRRMASAHPYDQVEILEAEKLDKEQGASAEDSALPTVTLRDGGDAVSESLLSELCKRMEPVGIAVDEARISHLAYSSEIAGIMLRKQAARRARSWPQGGWWCGERSVSSRRPLANSKRKKWRPARRREEGGHDLEPACGACGRPRSDPDHKHRSATSLNNCITPEGMSTISIQDATRRAAPPS